MPASSVVAIGSHGQTVRHRPDDANPFTLQIGDPNQIAEVTGIRTVADFRRRDMAAGGQAAPLVPPFHEALFAESGTTRVVLNVGGISNITVLAPQNPTRGFDTGPGNALMDAWYGKHQRGTFDRDGAWAAQGRCDTDLLAALMSDPYLSEPPPKSTGKEHYHLDWLSPQLGKTTPVDVQRTLTEFTAASIAEAVERWAPGAQTLIACGGGRLNPVLMTALDDRLGAVAVVPCDDLGVDGDSLEAAAFAWLAMRRLAGLHGNAPAVTGARGERILGGIYDP